MVFNSDQSIALIAGDEDVIFADIKNEYEIGLDCIHHVTDVKACLHANDKFYVLANKFQKNRGIFLIETDQDYPCSTR